MSQPSADRRLFVALWPTTPTLRRIEALQVRLPAVGRRVATANIHLTLAFLGKVSPERAAECDRALSRVRVPAFRLSLDRIGTWRRSRVLWLSTRQETESIQQLADEVRKKLADAGFPRESRPFRTHVTLARKVDRRPPVLRFQPIDWPVDRFFLTVSDLHPAGARYSNIREWTLS